jgi:hypothetical protein
MGGRCDILRRMVCELIEEEKALLTAVITGNRGEIIEGPPQGIFAPEYCDEENNFLSKCLLAWLITRTIDSPYLAVQGEWLEDILHDEGILDSALFERCV